MKEYCEVCGNKYHRFCDSVNEEVFCMCSSCGFKDSDDMTQEEIDRWEEIGEKLCGRFKMALEEDR